MNMSMIDRMYVNGLVGEQGDSIDVLVSTYFLHQFLVILVVKEEVRRTLSSLQIPKRVQIDDGNVDQVTQLWM